MKTLRYSWRKPSTLPERIELFDHVTLQPAAVILSVSRRYQWSRTTSILVHGAPPTEGVHTSLEEAKQAIVAELPDAEELCRTKPR